ALLAQGPRCHPAGGARLLPAAEPPRRGRDWCAVAAAGGVAHRGRRDGGGASDDSATRPAYGGTPLLAHFPTSPEKNGSTIDTAISTMMIHSSSSMRCVAARSASFPWMPSSVCSLRVMLTS